MKLTRVHNKVCELLNINPNHTTPKGWIIGGTCPFCGSDEKFGVRLNKPNARYSNHVSFNCFHGSCQRKGGEFVLLKELGQASWLKDGEHVNHHIKLENVIEQSEEDVEIEIKAPTLTKPTGFKRVSTHDYLNDRGFEPWQYEVYTIGVTKILSMFKDYVFFLITENGENKGYVARSIREKSWIEEHNKEIKAYNKTVPKSERKREYLRYINESAADFGRLLFGLDQVTEFTHTVILVEGITDKANVDRWLMRHDLDQEYVCLCTFGKKISDAQRIKLSMIDGLMTVIVMYDPDAVDEVKRYGQMIEGVAVKGVYLKDKDPGDLSDSEMGDRIESAIPIESFVLNRVQIMELK